MTVDELLNLPPEAWETISKMGEAELDIYLKDISIVEPVGIPAKSTPCISGEDKDIEEIMGETSDSNPIKMTKKKKKGKGKGEFSAEEISDILEGL